jgi:hypothetical protein
VRVLTFVLPILCALWMTDRWLSDDGTVGWERNSIRNSLDRWENRTHQRVAIMGSSTSKDWLPGGFLAKTLGVKRGSVVDAHINGCHQGCTWASVRRMQQRHDIKRCRWRGEKRCEPPKKKRFDAVFFGTNLFQMCEDGHSKRVLQHRMLLPTEDIPALMGIYGHARHGLRHAGRFFGMQMSEAYGDTRALRDYWGRKWIGSSKRGQEHRWLRKTSPKKEKDVLSCSYEPADVALKLRFTEALLDDLKYLSHKTYLMILPDRSLTLTDPVHRERWRKHRAAHSVLVASRPWVHLIDLTSGGVRHASQFRDGFHIKKSSYSIQQNLLKSRLKSLGIPPPPSPKAPQPAGRKVRKK